MLLFTPLWSGCSNEPGDVQILTFLKRVNNRVKPFTMVMFCITLRKITLYSSSSNLIKQGQLVTGIFLNKNIKHEGVWSMSRTALAFKNREIAIIFVASSFIAKFGYIWAVITRFCKLIYKLEGKFSRRAVSTK